MSANIRRVQLDVDRFDRELTAVGHGVASIDGQVHEHLFDLPLIGQDAAGVGCRQGGQFDVFTDQPRQHALRSGDDLAQVDDLRL